MWRYKTCDRPHQKDSQLNPKAKNDNNNKMFPNSIQNFGNFTFQT